MRNIKYSLGNKKYAWELLVPGWVWNMLKWNQMWGRRGCAHKQERGDAARAEGRPGRASRFGGPRIIHVQAAGAPLKKQKLQPYFHVLYHLEERDSLHLYIFRHYVDPNAMLIYMYIVIILSWCTISQLLKHISSRKLNSVKIKWNSSNRW